MMPISTLAALPPNCPPSDAVSPTTTAFYRFTAPKLCVGDVAPPDDWILPDKKRKGECVGRVDCCECHAHSLYRNKDDITKARDLSPFLRKKSVAVVSLDPSMGKVRNSPQQGLSSHYDWWPTDPTVAPSANVIEEGIS